jgi:hypothetical protein
MVLRVVFVWFEVRDGCKVMLAFEVVVEMLDMLDMMRVLDVRQLVEMTKGVYGCIDIFSRMTVINIFSKMTNFGMLTKGVDRCVDISSRMTVIDHET